MGTEDFPRNSRATRGPARADLAQPPGEPRLAPGAACRVVGTQSAPGTDKLLRSEVKYKIHIIMHIYIYTYV